MCFASAEEREKKKKPTKGEEEGKVFNILPLKSCHPSEPGTLPPTHLATTGPEMMNISHCGFSSFSKIEEKRFG